MAYDYMFNSVENSHETYNERRMKAEAEARSICDISKAESKTDCVVTVKLSGNALVSVLNALQYKIRDGALMDAPKWSPADGWWCVPHDLRLYAIIEQLRDQLAQQRCEASYEREFRSFWPVLDAELMSKGLPAADMGEARGIHRQCRSPQKAADMLAERRAMLVAS